jgi:serine/threonine-protein kinase
MTRPLRIREVAPDCPKTLAAVCDRAVSVDPADRYASAADFQAEIDRYLEENGHRVERRELAALMHWYFDRDRFEQSRRIEELLVGPAPSAPARSATESSAQSSAPVATVSDVGTEGLAPSRESAIPDFKPRWMRQGAVALTAAAIGAVAIAGGLPRSGHAPSSAASGEPLVVASIAPIPPAAAPPPASATTTPPDPELVWLSVRIHPPWAVAFLDNRQLAGNPFRAEVPKDSRVHLLRAGAPGFRAAERVVSFASDVELDITLHETPPHVHTQGVPQAAPSNSNTSGPEAAPSDTTAGERQAAPSNTTAGEPQAAPSNTNTSDKDDKTE